MKLKQYLTENDNPDEIISLLKRDCQHMIKIVKSVDHELFRGSNRLKQNNWIKTTVRQDRKPRDMDRQSQLFIDKFFKKKFGWTPRQQGLFCISNEVRAGFYGRVGVVFPIGKFTYLWSKEIADLYNRSAGHHDSFFADIKSLFMKQRSEEELFSDMIDTYQDNDIELALKNKKYKNHEIMIHCKEYYLIERGYYNLYIDDKL